MTIRPSILAAFGLVLLGTLTLAAFGWLKLRDHEHALDTRGRRVAHVEGIALQLRVEVDAMPRCVSLADFEALQRDYDQVVAELARRTEDLCFTIAIVAGEVAHRERLPGGVGDWCKLPPRTGGARVWRKRGWDVTDAEAAAIRARINPSNGATR